MDIEYVMKCTCCKKLKTLENFESKYRNTAVGRVLVKNKNCIDCLMDIKQCYSRFIERYGMTYYRYRLNKF